MIQWEIIQGHNDILKYRDIWDQLFDSGEYEASTSFEWTYALLSASLKENDTFLLMILRDAEEIVGIIPLVISETKKIGLSFLNLFPISEYENTHSDILLKNLSDELIKAFVTALSRLKHKWDVMRIDSIIEINPLIDRLEYYLKESSIKYRIRRTEPSFYLTLNNDYTDYLKKRSGKFRNYLKRMEKKLKAKGHLNVFGLEDCADINDAYKKLLFIEEKSWKHNHGTAISSIKERRDFFEKLCAGAYEKGRLHLHFLSLDNEPIAYNLGLIKDNKYLYLRTSFNDEFRKFGPATVLRAKLIEEMIHNNIQYFDFPAEPYEWEKQWTSELRWHKSLMIYNNTIKARLFPIYEDLKYRIKARQFDNDQFEYHDPRDIKP